MNEIENVCNQYIQYNNVMIFVYWFVYIFIVSCLFILFLVYDCDILSVKKLLNFRLYLSGLAQSIIPALKCHAVSKVRLYEPEWTNLRIYKSLIDKTIKYASQSCMVLVYLLLILYIYARKKNSPEGWLVSRYHKYLWKLMSESCIWASFRGDWRVYKFLQ